jgi:hypothetical protein
MVIEAGGIAAAVEGEVLAAFERYEEALAGGDVDTMDELFWSGEEVVRFGIADMQFGAAEVRAWRRVQPPLPVGRTLQRTQVLVLGPDAAVVTTCFSYPGRGLIGRQSQVWARVPEGWRIVSAHVSETAVDG